MKKLLMIAKDPLIKVNSQIGEYLFPSKVFLPIDEDANLLIKKREVLKGDPLFTYHNKTQYSPISGKILKIVVRENYLQKKETFLLIENDFMENDHYNGSNTTIVLSNDIMKKIQDNKEVDWARFQNKERLFLMAFEDEPYIATLPFLHKYHGEEILLLLDAVAEFSKIEKVILCLKETDSESILAFEQILNTYPNMQMQILPDFYPLKNPLFLKKYLKLSSQDEIVSSLELFDWYYSVVKMRKRDILYVTLTGDAIENPCVVKVKVGTLLSDVIEGLLFFRTESYDVYVNGLLQSILSSLESIVLTEEIRAVYFMKKKNLKLQKCISCGKCNEVCPMKCNPYKSVMTKGREQCEDCIACGLCNFVCPSAINISSLTRKEGITNDL